MEILTIAADDPAASHVMREQAARFVASQRK